MLLVQLLLLVYLFKPQSPYYVCDESTGAVREPDAKQRGGGGGPFLRQRGGR